MWDILSLFDSGACFSMCLNITSTFFCFPFISIEELNIKKFTGNVQQATRNKSNIAEWHNMKECNNRIKPNKIQTLSWTLVSVNVVVLIFGMYYSLTRINGLNSLKTKTIESWVKPQLNISVKELAGTPRARASDNPSMLTTKANLLQIFAA